MGIIEDNIKQPKERNKTLKSRLNLRDAHWTSHGRTDRATAHATKQTEKADTWFCVELSSFRVSKQDSPRIFCSSFKLFEHQTNRSSRVHWTLFIYSNNYGNYYNALMKRVVIRCLNQTRGFTSIRQSRTSSPHNQKVIRFWHKMGTKLTIPETSLTLLFCLSGAVLSP
jgi:hypothetical protein